jgi:GPH family glycoside/pentoside/hexuronide:cation symporter
MIKLGSTVAFAAGGYLINLTGFAVAHGAQQGAATIWRMRVVDFSVPAVSIVFSIWLLSRYRLSAEVMVQVRRQLDLRPLDEAGLVAERAP